MKRRELVLIIFGFRIVKRIKLPCRHWYLSHTHTPPFSLCNTGYYLLFTSHSYFFSGEWVPLSLVLAGVADVAFVCAREIRCEKFIGWRDWLDGVTRLDVANHPHRTKTLQSLVSRRGPLERKSTFKYCAGKIWVFPVLWLNRKNTVTVQVLLFVFQLKLRFRRLKNKSLRKCCVLCAPNCYHTSFTLETKHKESNLAVVLLYV